MKFLSVMAGGGWEVARLSCNLWGTTKRLPEFSLDLGSCGE